MQDSIDRDSAALINASFAITKNCNAYLYDTIQFLDSALYFINQSDTGTQVSYKWTFGDNTTSEEKEHRHAYTKSGTYEVRLIAYYKAIPADTFIQEVRILIGQKEFRSNHAYSQAIDVEEAPDNGLLILASSVDQYGDSLNYVLIRTDSLLKEKWRKNLSSPGIRLSSLKKINTNEFILAGNYSKGNTHQFALSKIDGNGNELWTKYISNLEGRNVYANSTTDGGFITIGNTGTGSGSYCMVVKCNSNGKEVWRQSFENPLGYSHLSDAQNIVETASGFVFAGLKRSLFSTEVIVTELDRSGNIAKQNSVQFNYNGSIFEAGTAATANAYMVNLVNTPYACQFPSDFSATAFPKVDESSLNWVIPQDEHFIFAEGSHQYAFATMTDEAGAEQWRTIIDHRIKLSCTSVLNGASRYCKRIIYTSSGDVVALSEVLKKEESGTSGESSL